MMSNLHSVGLTQFLTEASQYEQQIIRSTPADVDKVVEFINKNRGWMSFLSQHPNENRKPVKNLSERLRQIGSAEGKEAANTIDQYLNDVSLVHAARKADLPQTGKDMRDPEMKKALASASQTAKTEVTIEEINENHPRFKHLGFKDAEEVITFLINSPEKDRLKYVNFKGLPLNNEQFEKLINNCPNLYHIEIRKSLLKRDGLKPIANLTNLQSLDISECNKLESDDLRPIANLTNLQSLDISGCYRLKSDALKPIANLTNLQSLDISGCHELGSDALRHIANLINLQSLNISNCYNLKWYALMYIENLINLKSLNISGCSQLNGDALKYIANLTELQSLDIAWCTQLESDALKHLVNLKKLQSLDIGFCKQFERNSLKYLANLTSLQKLDIGGCKKLERDILNLFEFYGYITGKELEMLLNKLRNEF